MKAKDLKRPFSWEERRPLLDKGVLFVPPYYDKHQEWQCPSWSSLTFGNDHPVFIEYCSGNGAWIIEKAQTNPLVNWVAVERQFERVQKIWSKKENSKLANLLIVCGEALTFTREYLPADCVEGIFVNFPDPWPKKKHAKNRLLQAPFINELSRIIKPQGTSTIVTDDLPYCEQAIEEFLKTPHWKSPYASPHYVKEWTGYGTSYFENLWRGKGCEIKYMQFFNEKSHG